MKLYSSAISPYAARCRIQILHKQLPIKVLPPPGGMGSAALKALNPVGKIPVLDLGDAALAESWAIMEYLEACFPSPGMRPSEPLAAARQTELVRFNDLYLAPALFPLFLALRGATTQDKIETALAGLQTQLALLEAQFARKPESHQLDLIDAALLPVIWYARLLAAHFGKQDCLAEHPQLSAWWTQRSVMPAAASVLQEMDAGLRTAMPALFAASDD